MKRNVDHMVTGMDTETLWVKGLMKISRIYLNPLTPRSNL